MASHLVGTHARKWGRAQEQARTQLRHACRQACPRPLGQLLSQVSVMGTYDLRSTPPLLHAYLLQPEVAQVQHACELAEHEGLRGGVRSDHVTQLLAQRLQNNWGKCPVL